MKIATVEKMSDYDGEEVEVRGWLYNKRPSGKLIFLLLRDGTGIMQCVLSEGHVSRDFFDACEKLPLESSLILRGTIRRDRRAPGSYEMAVRSGQIVQQAEEYPITPKEHGVAFLLSHRHLWIRSRRQHAILRIRAEVIRTCRDFFDERGFILADTPVFTPAPCESTSTLFETRYFDQMAYLTQSGQLYNEATCMAFGRSYCFGPSFRAEKSKTRRHLTEFWQVEPEVAYADLDDMLKLAEELVVHIVESVLQRRREDLDVLERDTGALEKVALPFPRVRYSEAISTLRGKGVDIKEGDDFGAPHETELSNLHEKPLFVVRYPASIRPFYMKRDPEDDKVALCMDCLAPEGYGEIIGGGQREDDLETLLKRLEEYNLPRRDFEWYLDLRRYGSVPHAGFGLGIERTVAWICRVPHLRETIPFPRMLDRVYP
ncbi:MAG: asparagine--tRNA ligase [bacterium]